MNANFLDYWSQKLTVSDRREMYEQTYLAAILGSYESIDKTAAAENEIRNRFYWHLRKKNPLTKNLIDKGIMQLDFERWEMIAEDENSRTDLSLFISGFFRFDIECKLLFGQKSKNQLYLHKGIARFIDLKYGFENDHGGMMGFVVHGDPKTVFESIPPKVSAYHACKPARAIIKPINGDWNYGFVSYHLRKDGRDIQLYHLVLPFQG